MLEHLVQHYTLSTSASSTQVVNNYYHKAVRKEVEGNTMVRERLGGIDYGVVAKVLLVGGEDSLLRKQEESQVMHVAVNNKQNGKVHFISHYTSMFEDRKWATSGMVASVITEDSTIALQQRVEDEGFNFVVVTPMGGDRVFLHCTGGEDI